MNYCFMTDRKDLVDTISKSVIKEIEYNLDHSGFTPLEKWYYLSNLMLYITLEMNNLKGDKQ